jgi:hypothetical protein
MRMILPSGIATLVKLSLAGHPELALISDHVTPSSVDRQVSFKSVPLESLPPRRMILPSGIATLVNHTLADHPELALISDHVAPSSVDRQVSFSNPALSRPPMRMMLSSGIATLVWPFLAGHPEFAFTSVHVAPPSVDFQVSFKTIPPSSYDVSSPPIRTILPSGISTLVCATLADHPALALTSVHGCE